MHNPKIHAGQTGQVQDRLHHGAPKWLKWTEGTSHTASRGLLLRGPHRYISIQASSAFRPRCHRQSQPQQIGHPRQATLCHALEVVLAHKCTHVQGRGLGAGKNAGLFGTDFATQLALCWDEMRWLRWHGKSGYISNPLVQMHVMTLLPPSISARVCSKKGPQPTSSWSARTPSRNLIGTHELQARVFPLPRVRGRAPNVDPWRKG